MAALAKVFLLLTVTMFVVGSAVIGIARMSYRDPFAPYRAIMPGQASDNLQAYSCDLSKAGDTMSCAFNADATFSGRVTVEVEHHIVTSVQFLIRSDDMQFGDLVLCWGKPSGTILNVPPHSNAYVDIYWGNYIYAEFAQSNRLVDDFQSVNFLSIGDMPPLCGSRQ